MSQEILLSIIVPVYNVEQYLRRCLDSLLRIESITLEIILVNDGSTDNSLSICQEYADKYTHIILINQENKGQSATRNIGLQRVKGRYTAFIDSDDSVEPLTLESSVLFLEGNKWCDMVQFPVLLEAGSSKEKHIISGKGEIRGLTNLLYEFSVKESISWRVCDKVFRSKLIHNIRFQEGIVYEDNLYMCHVLLRGKGIYLSDYGCYNYFHNPNSTTHSRSEKSYIDMCMVHGEMYKLIAQSSLNSTIRTHMIYRVVNDVYASLVVQGINHPCVSLGSLHIKQLTLRDIVRADKIHLSRRIKIILIKVLSFFK